MSHASTGGDGDGGLARLVALVIERTGVLCAIPAPAFHEGQRAEVVRDWWDTDGLSELRIDKVGNVHALLRKGDPALPTVYVCAHLDTVFSAAVKHGVTWKNGRLLGPSVGDDTVAVCSLSALHSLLPPALRHPVRIVATVGEEGLGNLAGVTALLDEALLDVQVAAGPVPPVRAVIALEGNYLGRVNVIGVGSTRWEVTVTGPGGHAWEDADDPSAVHIAAALITRLDGLRDLGTARQSKATVNVGRIEGGESVNSRAGRVTFLLDLRSDDAQTLERLRQAALDILQQVPAPVTVSLTPIGDRPAGRLDPRHPLARVAADALRGVGVSPLFTAASTDANAAYARAIPAVTLGITTGDATHTEQEWIDIAPVAAGLRALASTITALDHLDHLDEQEW